jgi:succinate dehydrogenase / fumarate reductase membrane anchor subunit
VSYHVDGLRGWLLQRISAAYLAIYLLGVCCYFWLHPAPGYAEWRDWFAQPLVAVTSSGFILAVLVHGWVGMRDVLLDYVHPLGLRLLLLTLLAFLLIGTALWGVRVLILASGLA